MTIETADCVKSSNIRKNYLENAAVRFYCYYSELKKYTKVHKISADNLGDLIEKLKNYNTVIVGFHKSNENPWKSYKFTNKELTWLYEIARTNTVILDVFTRPYALMDIKSIENIEAIVMSYQNSDIAQQKSAQTLFGHRSGRHHQRHQDHRQSRRRCRR